MKKKAWITSLSQDQALITRLLQTAKKYGLSPDGHFWVDDIPKSAWRAPLEPLLSKETAVWVISFCRDDLEAESVWYGLSLLCLSVQNARGIGFPVILICPDKAVLPGDLPTPFKGCDILSPDNPALGPRMVAQANTPVKAVPMDYRIDIHTGPGIGIWYELGPAGGAVWKGVLAGGLAAGVNAHGVGPKGRLPLKTTLEYPMQGLRLTLGSDTYTAWAVQNTLDDSLSYYARFEDAPGRILFGQLPGEEQEADLHVLNLSRVKPQSRPAESGPPDGQNPKT